ASGKDVTLTGRTDFWPQLVDRIWRRPILGYGFSGFWLPWLGDKDPSNNITTIGGYFRPFHAHNGFLDTAIQTGLLGLTLFVASFIKNATLAILYIRRNQSFEAVFPLLILVFIVISNISESSLLATNFQWFYYVLVTVRLNSYSSELENLKIKSHNTQNPFLRKYS
ncbi:MAG TPA: O-antigen ligase family protein, partial [Phormidium sp.]